MSFAGQGAITSNDVSLSTATQFQSDPPTFTLFGYTRGGPPTTYTWRRNGIEITRNSEVVGSGTYSIKIGVTRVVEVDRLDSAYTSTLVVTGDLPGVYEYTVSNRAMASSVTDSYSIQGK